MGEQEKYLNLGKRAYNTNWLKKVSQDHAVKLLAKSGIPESQVRNAWKRANGLTSRNYENSKTEKKEVKTVVNDMLKEEKPKEVKK